MTDNTKMNEEFARLKRHERHYNAAETRYWCNQYKLFAQKLLDEQASGARMVPEWISVTDRLPEQDVSFLAVTDCGGDIYISTMRLPVLISKNSKPDGDFIRERVTYWMPLPAAPEPKK